MVNNAEFIEKKTVDISFTLVFASRNFLVSENLDVSTGTIGAWFRDHNHRPMFHHRLLFFQEKFGLILLDRDFFGQRRATSADLARANVERIWRRHGASPNVRSAELKMSRNFD